jgi:HlyD family secretion protein
MKRRGLLFWLIPLLVAGLAIGLIRMRDHRDEGSQYRTVSVERGSITSTVTASATVNPLVSVQVGSQVSGRVARIYVDFNERVHAGQIVAELDRTFLAAAVSEAKASLMRAEASRKEAERKLRRGQDLKENDLLSQSELEALETASELAQAECTQAQAALERAQTNLLYATIYSPVDGVVISRDIDVGQTVAASLQAPTLFTIANDLRRMQAEAAVDEADIGKVSPGQEVSFTVDAFPDRVFKGKISQIRLVPVTVQNVVTYAVIVQVDNKDLKLRPGMTASVSISVAHRENVLKVPNSALRFRPPVEAEAALREVKSRNREDRSTRGGSPSTAGRSRGRGPRVWILGEDGRLRPVSVTLGITDGSYTEVVSGDLREGQPVVVGLALTTAGETSRTPLTGTPPGPSPMGRRF